MKLAELFMNENGQRGEKLTHFGEFAHHNVRIFQRGKCSLSNFTAKTSPFFPATDATTMRCSKVSVKFHS